jgi:hypothetical protein
MRSAHGHVHSDGSHHRVDAASGLLAEADSYTAFTVEAVASAPTSPG